MPGEVPQYLGKDESGNEEVSYVSADGKTWVNPVGYGQDLATNKMIDPLDPPAIGATQDGLEDAAEEAEGSATSRDCYVTNVCVKALTVSSTLSDDSGDGPDSLPDSGGSENQKPIDIAQNTTVDASGLAATGDGAIFAIAAIVLAAIFAALIAMVLTAKHRTNRFERKQGLEMPTQNMNDMRLIGERLCAAAIALVLIVALLPMLPSRVHAVELPDSAQFATVEDLQAFNTNDNDGVKNPAKVYFGSDGQQWWIAGSQDAGNMTLFVAPR